MPAYLIQSSSLTGTIAIPPSKSHTLRAILFALMASGKSVIRNYLDSPDMKAALNILTTFGASYKISTKELEIHGLSGKLPHAENVIDVGNSGILLRFATALSALSPGYTVITGDYSIRHQRPMKELLQGLTQLGAFASSCRMDGYAPVMIKGPIVPGNASISGEDSQPVSALLFACCFLNGQTFLSVANPGEKPWVNLTLQWLKKLGIEIEHHNFLHYKIPGLASYPGFDFQVPGDLSSAAYPIAAAVITGSEITLDHIDLEDHQGDKKVIDILVNMGANIEIFPLQKRVIVKKTDKLKGCVIDGNECIDAVTTLAVLACFAESKTEIHNIAVARTKECDRLHAITLELKKMNANIEEYKDAIVIHPSNLLGNRVRSHEDHRMALSLSIAAMRARGETVIEDVDCIKKTYPTFIHDFQKLGAKIQYHGK